MAMASASTMYWSTVHGRRRRKVAFTGAFLPSTNSIWRLKTQFTAMDTFRRKCGEMHWLKVWCRSFTDPIPMMLRLEVRQTVQPVFSNFPRSRSNMIHLRLKHRQIRTFTLRTLKRHKRSLLTLTISTRTPLLMPNTTNGARWTCCPKSQSGVHRVCLIVTCPLIDITQLTQSDREMKKCIEH